MFTRLAGLDYATYLHVLRAHDDLDIRHRGNMHACSRTDTINMYI
jgi:hypothetical protein